MVAHGVARTFDSLEAELKSTIPICGKSSEPGSRSSVGSLPICHDGDEIDRFQVEIPFPDGINKLPSVREVGGRIPRDSDYHINAGNRDICTTSGTDPPARSAVAR